MGLAESGKVDKQTWAAIHKLVRDSSVNKTKLQKNQFEIMSQVIVKSQTSSSITWGIIDALGENKVFKVYKLDGTLIKSYSITGYDDTIAVTGLLGGAQYTGKLETSLGTRSANGSTQKTVLYKKISDTKGYFLVFDNSTTADISEIETKKAQGWSPIPPQGVLVYKEGIYLVITTGEIQSYLANGWKTDPLTAKTGTSKNDALIERLKSEPSNTNYQKLLEIIEENGITDFTYEIFQSIVDSGTCGTLESANYILGNNFKYLAEYNGLSCANFYVLMVDGEITLIRVGRDKTQVGFYDITKTDFFSQEFNGRDASTIFNDYLPATGLDQDLNYNEKLSNEKYKFYENKSTHTTDIFWKNLKSDSAVIKKLANGLDTIKGVEDNTGIASDFGDVYKKTEIYPQKNNAFVLGEIYGHADGLNKSEEEDVTGKNKFRYWVADVENPNTIPTDVETIVKQTAQNAAWMIYAVGR